MLINIFPRVRLCKRFENNRDNYSLNFTRYEHPWQLSKFQTKSHATKLYSCCCYFCLNFVLLIVFQKSQQSFSVVSTVSILSFASHKLGYTSLVYMCKRYIHLGLREAKVIPLPQIQTCICIE